MLRNHQMEFVQGEPIVLEDIMTGLTTEHEVQNLVPQSKYTYAVEAVTPNGNVPSVNTMQLQTAALDAPEVSEASNISGHGFTANWGVSAYASGYLLDVFEQTGKADTTETESFDNVGSTGKPLPDGWEGTASGNYTTTTSSGNAVPSVALKNNAEWLQTKTYALPVKELTFMYRFASAATGSSFGLYGLSNGSWTKIDSVNYVNTSKTNPVYTFSESQQITAFRIIYHKAAGNLSIDDVSATYGNQEKVLVKENVPSSNNSIVVDDLSTNKIYYYNVRATLKSAVSPRSENMSVLTLLNDDLRKTNNPSLKIYSTNAGVIINGLNGDEVVHVFSFTGVCIYQGKASGTQLQIPLKQNGIYFLRIQNLNYIYTQKFLK